ncbi:MAG: HDIG domain-containing protein [Acidobacteria bacterium]|nr:HDIG domain-containing protein [Acidobacteriota bacterium]
MATSAGFEKWGERPRQRWYLELLENLRSGLTWIDALAGVCATAVIALILVGFRSQVVPDYEVGQIADQEVRAAQDVFYEDRMATDLRRAEAEAAVPAVYQLESDLISSQVKSTAAVFSEARDILAEAGPGAQASKARRGELLEKLRARAGGAFPPQVLEALLRYNFSPDLEARMLELLDTVLRDGIIRDRGEFLKDLRSGILVRDGSYTVEHPLTDAYRVRDLSAAKEFLRQSPIEHPGMSQRDRATILSYLEGALFPTLLCDREETDSRRALASRQVKPVEVQLKQGQTVVRSGEQVTPQILMQLSALRNLRRPRSLIWQFGGYFLIAAILIYSLWRYFVYYQTRHRKIRNHAVLILAVIGSELLVLRLLTSLADILGERFPRFQDPYVLYYGIPFAFGALLITLLVDVNLGVLSSVVLAILCGLFYGHVELSAYCIIGSLAGIYSIRQYKDRAAILKSGLTIGVANIACLAALAIMRQAPLRFSDALDQFVLALLGGMLASALCSMLLPALETLFKITTDIRLLELSNLNAPLLRRLAVEAPGTYHHSLMVATLAEAAAEAIGANPLLARVGAYYHDIGKLLKPEYFVENQAYGGNKHEDLSPSMSCLIISSHVKDGLHFARSAGLPQRISDMIPQHHGTRIMTFFYQKAKEAADADRSKLSEADFRYPGPRPRSREAGIMMMADSVEAASRTLGEAPAPAQIRGMIDRLADSVIGDHQFDECDLTFRDVKLIKESFFKILAGIFHHRIEYPGYDFKRTGDGSGETAPEDPGPQQAKTG